MVQVHSLCLTCYCVRVHFCLHTCILHEGAPPPPGVPGAPPPPGGFGAPRGPMFKEKKKYKLDVQMRRMNWNQVR